MKRKAFTLIETLIASVIFAGILIALGDLFMTHQNAYVRTAGAGDAQRFAAVVQDEIARRIRPSSYVMAGLSSDQRLGAVLFPAPGYAAPPMNPTGNYTTTDEHYVTLALDPFAQNQMTIQFYRPTGTSGGTIYIYNCARLAPPPSPTSPCAMVSYSPGLANPVEDLEMWWTRNWVTMRLSVRDSSGSLIQNQQLAYIRYYN